MVSFFTGKTLYQDPRLNRETKLKISSPKWFRIIMKVLTIIFRIGRCDQSGASGGVTTADTTDATNQGPGAWPRRAHMSCQTG